MINDSPRPDDADPSSITEIILDGYKRMNRGVTKCKEGNMIGGMAEISIGLMEYHVAMAMWIQHL
ncbi:hypothetical protein JCM15415_18980 [Methanobacterium movens]